MTSRFSRKLRGPEKGKADFRSRQTERDERCARTETKRRKAPDDMNAAPGFRLGRLAGLPRTCARYASSEAVAAAAAPVAAAAVAKPVAKPPPEGHGQKIWVHANRLSDNVVYSFKPAVEGFHALKQIAFAGKKSKPAKMRKDQWYPMAVISFPDGQGAVGRSAFQKLRELKRLHEVSWSGEVAYHDPSEYNVKQRQLAAERHADGETFKITRHRRHRAKAIQRQRLNSIADMAAVLAGQGSGNKVRLAAERGEEGDGEKEAERLVPVTINWADQQDREYAQQWSENVTHEEFGKPAPALETS